MLLSLERIVEKVSKGDKVMKHSKALLGMEDNKWRKVVERILEPEISELIITTDGLEAIELFRRDRFDIVLIDESIEKASPAEVVMNLRDIAGDFPTIIVTGDRLPKYQRIWEHCGVAFAGSRMQAMKYLPWAIREASAKAGISYPKRRYN